MHNAGTEHLQKAKHKEKFEVGTFQERSRSVSDDRVIDDGNKPFTVGIRHVGVLFREEQTVHECDVKDFDKVERVGRS